VTESTAEGGGSFAARLKRLVEVVPRPHEQGGGTYSVAEIATGVGVSRQHLYDLMSGKKQRPAWDLVNNLANFFGVSVVYFGDDDAAEEYAEQLELLAALSKSDVKDIALRSGQLSPQHRGVLINMLEQLQSLEREESN
jgi:transcriptional regulator with XRE-family HTH domain